MLRRRSLLFLIGFLSLTTFVVCQQTTSDTSQTPNGMRSNHVVVIMEENRSINYALEYMPYLVSVANQYSEGMQVYSDSHGSWLAYGELTAGLAPFNGQADNGLCNGDGCSQTINVDNIVRRLTLQGKSWRGYFQTMPSIGYLGYQYGLYVRRHNPFAFYNDVDYLGFQRLNMFPADPYMLQDIQNNRLANFTWISPDLDHDAHNGPNDQSALMLADQYLQTFLPQLLASPPFQPGGDGVLMVTFDEGELSGDNHCGGYPDPNNCGGHIWQVLIGPNVNRGYQSDTHYKQGSELRLFCDLLGLNTCPGDGATSPPMTEFFQGTPSCPVNQDRTVSICSPTANGNMTSPLQIVSAAMDNEHTITGMVAYANGQIVAQSSNGTLNATISLNPGQYQLVIRAWDSSGYYFSSQENFTVTSSSSPENPTEGSSDNVR
jgi:phosphatidylinositol-3-phosphatase